MNSLSSAFSSAYDSATHLFSAAVEKDEVKALRSSIKVGMHTAKVLATAALVVSVVGTLLGVLFGTCIGGGFGSFWALSTLILTTPICILTRDVIKASDTGYLLASIPKNFALFNYHETLGKARVIQECHTLVNAMLKDTCFLKHASRYILDRYVEGITYFLRKADS